MDVGGVYPVSSKGAVLVSLETQYPERVILTAWLALPGAIVAGEARVGACVASHRAVSVKRHYAWERARQLLIGIITIDARAGYLPHAFNGWSGRSSRSEGKRNGQSRNHDQRAAACLF